MTQSPSYVLQVSGVGKCYAKYSGLLARLLSWAGFPIKASQEYWANKDISFTVAPGQAIAIIGQNGAGKSTLLKMITGTVRPSTGDIQFVGRISAMLELGLGFNPEFTGRQNAYMAGGLLGYSAQELEGLMKGIEEFAEIGDFFDQPLRVYSSGMQARLAFAVATAVRPDVLIVDEILSVGDSYFQHRSFDRIKQFKEQGTSIILVTHGLADVRSLCDHVILLEKGQILKQGRPDEVVDFYNAFIAQKESAQLNILQNRDENGWLKTTSGDKRAEVTKLSLRDQQSGTELAVAQVGQMVELVCEVKVNTPIEQLVLGFMLRDKQGGIIWGSNTWHTDLILNQLQSGENLVYRLPFKCTLGAGSYSVTTALTRGQSHLDENFEWQDNLLVFDVINANKPAFIGSTWLDTEFSVSRIGNKTNN
jgi:lipopolysaccharide transport system ATP-binding protein